MENETAIEKSIKEFVFSKSQEQVYLDVSKSKVVAIKHQSKHGSIALAMLWLRVFRHQNNYPMPKYPYKELYDKQGYNKVLLKVDDVTLTVFMSSGVLKIQGEFVIEWFLNTFPAILDNYDAEVREPRPLTTLYRQYTENWKRIQGDNKARQALEDSVVQTREDRALEIADDRNKVIMDLQARVDLLKVQKLAHRSSVVAGEATDAGEPAEDTDKGDNSEAEKLKLAAETVAADLAEEIELMALDVWSDEVLDKQLNRLRTCSVWDGSAYVYRLWKSLLHRWLDDSSRKVYIVTPRLDEKRLLEVCQIVLDHRYEANLDGFYVRQQCDHNNQIYDIKRAVLNKFGPKDQMFLEYKTYSCITYPLKKFNANFIAAVKDGEAEVMVTSAGFHGDHFECDSMESVQYQVMSDFDFIRGFLSRIIGSALTEK